MHSTQFSICLYCVQAIFRYFQFTSLILFYQGQPRQLMTDSGFQMRLTILKSALRYERQNKFTPKQAAFKISTNSASLSLMDMPSVTAVPGFRSGAALGQQLLQLYSSRALGSVTVNSERLHNRHGGCEVQHIYLASKPDETYNIWV